MYTLVTNYFASVDKESVGLQGSGLEFCLAEWPSVTSEHTIGQILALASCSTSCFYFKMLTASTHKGSGPDCGGEATPAFGTQHNCLKRAYRDDVQTVFYLLMYMRVLPHS